jgi:N-acetylneuraminate synthase
MTKLIAELGLNHNGSIKNLIKMSEMSLDAGFDYIKVQLRTPRLCVPKDQWNKPREWFDGTPMTYIEYKERIELSDEQFGMWMKQYQGRAFASVWDIPSLEKLVRYKPPYIKIPSALLTSDLLINTAIDTGIPIILSTGMSTLDEIDHAVNLFPSTYDLILMHCTSTYPVADEEINLRAIKTLRDRYMIPVGYSSHDKSPFSSLYALALGAWGIEAHVTLDRAMKGTDQSASLEKPALELIARERNRIPVVMGDGKKVVYASEKSSLEKLRGM